MNGTSIGPMSKEQMMAYDINENTPVSRDGGPWAPLFTYPELMEFYRMKGGMTMNEREAANVSSKKLICGICAILVGGLGVQYFVLGKVGGGFITILLTLITCGVWEIITLIQGIMMLCMSDADFKAKYMDTPKTFPLF